GGSQKPHEYFYWEFHEAGFHQAVRMGNWKGIRLGPKEPVELYDLESDPGERNNVAARHPDVVRRITEIMASARTESYEWPILTPEEAKKRAI
ncbi:MAG TPA: hypothetical protein PLP04_12235, partial [Bryobacteraceae bacterium]|nr:hypothetical protein [Bryobacteraceae bacterium]